MGINDRFLDNFLKFMFCQLAVVLQVFISDEGMECCVLKNSFDKVALFSDPWFGCQKFLFKNQLKTIEHLSVTPTFFLLKLWVKDLSDLLNEELNNTLFLQVCSVR